MADVVDRIASIGNHPTANEAWGLVLASRNESDTVVWTEQIAEAAGIAQPRYSTRAMRLGQGWHFGTPMTGFCESGRRSRGGLQAWAATQGAELRHWIGR